MWSVCSNTLPQILFCKISMPHDILMPAWQIRPWIEYDWGAYCLWSFELFHWHGWSSWYWVGLFVPDEHHYCFCSEHQNPPSLFQFHFNFLFLTKRLLMSKIRSMPFLLSTVLNFLKRLISFKFYHLNISTSSGFMIWCMALSVDQNAMKIRTLFVRGVRLTWLHLRLLGPSFVILLCY